MTFYRLERGLYLGDLQAIYQPASLHDLGVRAVLRLDSQPQHHWLEEFTVLHLPHLPPSQILDQALPFLRHHQDGVIIQDETVEEAASALGMAYGMEYHGLPLADAYVRVLQATQAAYPSEEWLRALTERYQQAYTAFQIAQPMFLDWLVRQVQSRIDPIREGLYVSGISALQHLEQVRALGIGAVLRLDKAPRQLAQWPDDFTLLDVPLTDGMGLQAHHLTTCLDFMQAQHTQGQGVLVHCQMGMSRSVVMVMGHLVRDQGFTLGQAYQLVRRQRPIAAPNPYLVKALIQHLGLPFAPDLALGLHFLQDLAETS